MNNELYSNNDYRYYSLAHHGILGQKWGVRRYQSSDGSLTDEGRKRYGKSVKSLSDEELDMRLLNYQERELDDNRPFSKEDYRNRDELLDEYYRRNPSKNYKPKKNLEDSYSEKDLLNDDGKAWNKLYKEVNEKSGNWYFSESRSRNFQRCIDYSENRSREINNKYKTQDLYKKASDYLDANVYKKTKGFWDGENLKPEFTSGDGKKQFEKAFEKASNEARKDPAYVKLYNEYRTASQNRQKEMTKLSEELDDYLAGAVLDDLGYKDTDEARRMLIRSNVLRPD